MGVLIDIPKPGFGTSNMAILPPLGNPTRTSKITGIDENLIMRLHTILIAMICGHKIISGIL